MSGKRFTEIRNQHCRPPRYYITRSAMEPIYTIPHRCSVRKTCIHCNMCNNARLETRKIGLHFCGTLPYTREPHQLLFTGAEPSG
jgi:hypothetical protein